MKELTQARLQELLAYDPETGILTNRRLCRPAGSSQGTGYLQIEVDGRKYLAHRLAWLYAHGKFPEKDLDHVDGDRGNNRLSNLREATRAENMQNRVPTPGASGFPGVYCSTNNGSRTPRKKAWCARIRAGADRRHLGYFATPEEAHAAYITAKAEVHTFSPTLRSAT